MTLQEAKDKIEEVLGDDVGYFIEAQLAKHTYAFRDPIESPLEYQVTIKHGVYNRTTKHDDLETCVDIALRTYDVEYAKLNSQALLDALKTVKEAGYNVL